MRWEAAHSGMEGPVPLDQWDGNICFISLRSGEVRADSSLWESLLSHCISKLHLLMSNVDVSGNSRGSHNLLFQIHSLPPLKLLLLLPVPRVCWSLFGTN